MKTNIFENMSKKLLSGLFIALILSIVACTDNKTDKAEIPEGAIPIVYRGHLYVIGSADSTEGNFVFDTGASNLYYDSIYYAGGDFKYSNFWNAKLPGAGKTPQDVIVIADSVNFRFGNNLYQTKNIPVLHLKPILGDFADGIFGMEYFSHSVLEINYKNEFMRIFPTIDSVDVSQYCKIDLIKKDNRLYIPLKVKINDTLLIEGEFQLDLGSGGTIAFTSSTTTKFQLLETVGLKTHYFTKYGGVGGESSRYDFMANSLKIGDFILDNVTMNFHLDKSGAMASDKHFGLLGNKIYERFNVYIDFTDNAIYLKPNKNFREAFEFSRLGFTYVDRSQTLKSWIVTGLYTGSDAEINGLKIDDKILSVNEISVDSISYESQEKFFADLNKVKLKIDRNSVFREIEFSLQSIQ
jgi:PDZ domain-containing protein